MELNCVLFGHKWTTLRKARANEIADSVGYGPEHKNFKGNMKAFEGFVFKIRQCNCCGKVVDDITFIETQFRMFKENLHA